MKTLLFDADSGKVISPIFENGYLVDDQPQPVDPPIFELEYKPTSMPAHEKGNKVHFPTAGDPVYRSKIDANVWSPTEYPQGWEKL